MCDSVSSDLRSCHTGHCGYVSCFVSVDKRFDVCGLFVGAAILGIIIAVMEDGDFPGWGTLIICVLAASLPSFAINQFTPPALFFVGPLVGAVTGGFAISYTCGMPVKRACIAVGIYFGIQIVLGIALVMLASGVDSAPTP